MRKLWAAFIAALAVTLALELVVPSRPHFAVEALFGFNAVYGFLSCALLILVAKAIGLLAKRPEGYYRDE